MFGKFFSSAFTGSMAGAGSDAFALWAYVISNARDSHIELNPILAAAAIGCSIENVNKAIEYLCAPDPKSRNKADNGCRMVLVSGFVYRIPSFEIYRGMRDDTDRQRYMREYMQNYRKEKSHVNQDVNSGKPSLAQSESESESESETKDMSGSPVPEKKEKKSEIYSPYSRVALHYLNERTGKHFRESSTSLAPIHARMQEDGVDLDGVRKMIDRQCEMWMGTRMQEYLRPETLFGREKFNAYYAAKDQPISLEERKTAPQSHQTKSNLMSIVRAI